MSQRCAVIGALCLAVVACGGTSTTGATCGSGTMLVNGQCVATAVGGGGGGAVDADGAGGASGTGGMANDGAGGTLTGVDGGAIPSTCPNPSPPASSLIDDFEDGFLRGWFT